MRSAWGIVALREIARRFGPVEVAFVEVNEPHPWTVSLVGSFSHEHGSSLEETASALLDDLERFGPMTVEEAERLGRSRD